MNAYVSDWISENRQWLRAGAYEGWTSCLADSSQGFTTSRVKAFAGSLPDLEAVGQRNDDHIRTKSSISSYQCARRPRTEHVSGSSKDSSDDNDQRVEGGVTLGVLVDGRSGLSSVGSGGETSGLGLSRAKKMKKK